MNALPILIVLSLLGQVSESRSYSTVDGNPVIYPAYIKVRDEAKIPAREAGELVNLTVREGARVKQGELLAQIDDSEPKMAVEVAEYNELAARKRFEQDIEERYARAASELAQADLNKDLEANSISKGAVAASEIERKKLDLKRALLQIEKAHNDRKMAGYEAKVKRAERKAAEMAVGRRVINAPFDGEVVKTFMHQSEWANPGDPILKLMRLDTLYVEGRIRAEDYDRAEVKGKPVTIEVTKARGRKATISGKIVYVDQMQQGGGRYLVRAEVTNELVNDSWLLNPNGVCRMTIHMDGTARIPQPSRR